MSLLRRPSGPPPAPPSLHAPFLAILPRIERHGEVYFRHVKCPNAREELLAELRGLAWKWFVRLARRGKDATHFASALAAYAARAVRGGRRVCGHERAREVLSPVAQRRRHFAVGKLPDFSTLNGNPWRRRCTTTRSRPCPSRSPSGWTSRPGWRPTPSGTAA